MPDLSTGVVVIGGGSTGAGVLRDLAMRGIDAVLVEKGDLASGTTGRSHGLLHSGGRYCVNDLQAAIECVEEGRILGRSRGPRSRIPAATSSRSPTRIGNGNRDLS